MALFVYHALDDAGRAVAGEIEASDVPQAAAQLQAAGLRVQSIALASSAVVARAENETAASAQPASTDHASHNESAVLKTHLAAALERSRNIAPALEAYAADLPKSPQRRRLQSACAILRQGDVSAAAAALADLPEFWIPLMGAATASRDPGFVLREFLAESKNADELRHRWWLTLAYPLILLGLAVAIMTALSHYVIPGFRDIFKEFAMTLPALTQFVLAVSRTLATWGFGLLAIIAVLLGLVFASDRRLRPLAGIRWLRDRLWLPFSWRTKIARLARFLADLLEADLPIPDALRIAGFTVEQRNIRRSTWQLAHDLETTGSFSMKAYRRSLTAGIVHALSAELSPAARLRLLRAISDAHAERVSIGLSWMTGIIEPLAIVVVGLVVGCTVLALFLPLVRLVEGLSM
jgi:type II secretory pathway component PulF